MCKSNILIVDGAQHAAILAALRLYQQLGESSIGADIENIASNGGEFAPLMGDQLDALCESINQTAPAKRMVVEALKANGFEFRELLSGFAETEESSPFVKAARKLVKNDEGSVEVDDPSVVSRGDKEGAYVLGWIYVSNEEAGVLPNSVVLERLYDVLEDSDDESFNARRLWLEETLSNFSEEIDDLESGEVGDAEPDQIHWEQEGKVYTFHPSEALKDLLASVERTGTLDAPDIARVNVFIDRFGGKLNRALHAHKALVNQL